MDLKICLTVVLLTAAIFTPAQVNAAPLSDGDLPTKATSTTSLPPLNDQDENEGETPSSGSTPTSTATTTSSSTEQQIGPQEVHNCAQVTKESARAVGMAAKNLSAYIVSDNYIILCVFMYNNYTAQILLSMHPQPTDWKLPD